MDALAGHFLKLGHEPVVLVPRPRSLAGPTDAGLCLSVCRHPRFVSTRHFVSWYQIPALRARQVSLRSRALPRRLPQRVRGRSCKTKLGVPLVITSHGGDVGEGNVAHHQAGRATAPRHGRPGGGTALVSIGRFTDEGFRRLYPEAPRIVTILNGIRSGAVPIAGSSAGRSGPRQSERIATRPFLGRPSRRKGVDVLSAMAIIPATERVRLVVAGSGEERAAPEFGSRTGWGSRIACGSLDAWRGRTKSIQKLLRRRSRRLTVRGGGQFRKPK